MAEEIATISHQPSAISHRTNAHWNNLKHSPLITIQTPVYNRRSTIKRAIDSVQAQTFRDIEYIIVDDGSDPEQAIDDIVDEFMKTTDLPVMFIKKPNGGVHTARNAAVREARGKFITGVDSDDELTPDSCQTNIDAWESIPEDKRHLYRGVMSMVRDQTGKLEGELFPEGVNSMKWEDVRAFELKQKCDHHDLVRAEILKANLLPEPEGVKFVGEGLLWMKLVMEYKAWCINTIGHIAHLEGNDHLSKDRKWNLQRCRDSMWGKMYVLNNPEIYGKGFVKYVADVMRYHMTAEVLKKVDPEFVKRYPLSGLKNKIWSAILYIPAKLASKIIMPRLLQKG